MEMRSNVHTRRCSERSTGKRYAPLWSTIHPGLVVNIIPGDDIIEARGDGSAHGKDELPVEGFLQQLQDFLTLLTGGQEGDARGAAVPHSWVRVLRLLMHVTYC